MIRSRARILFPSDLGSRLSWVCVCAPLFLSFIVGSGDGAQKSPSSAGLVRSGTLCFYSQLTMNLQSGHFPSAEDS